MPAKSRLSMSCWIICRGKIFFLPIPTMTSTSWYTDFAYVCMYVYIRLCISICIYSLSVWQGLDAELYRAMKDNSEKGLLRQVGLSSIVCTMHVCMYAYMHVYLYARTLHVRMYVMYRLVLYTDDVQLRHRIFLIIYDECIYSPSNMYINFCY